MANQQNTVEKLREDGSVIWRINRKTKNGYYRVNPDSSQHKYCERISIKGFDRLPTGLWKEGYGLTASGAYLLQELFDKFNKKISLEIVSVGNSHMDGRGKKTKVSLNGKQLASLNQSVRAVKSVRSEEIRTEVRQFLGDEFAQFKEYKDSTPDYSPGSLAQILKKEKVVDTLGADDIDCLNEFIPDYIASTPGTLKAKKKLKVVLDSLDAGRKVYLEKIVSEFEKKLQKTNTTETTWQKFLSDYILVLRNSYGEVLEKESVSISGKFPDFLLIDPYSYLDIYEIKKPNTGILSFDSSRSNYYWSTEVSKAISQIENYLYQVQRNSSALIEDIRKSSGIEISIVRPRGYLICGVRSQLKNDKMSDDFRILNDSLKNIDVIFYDDLLSNLKTFVERVDTADS